MSKTLMQCRGGKTGLWLSFLLFVLARNGVALAEGDPIVGAERSRVELCQECHGADGNSGALYIPKLAGQSAAYVAKQLRDFQSGAREHPVMNVMAEALSEADRQNIGAYFSAQPVMKSEAEGVAMNTLFANGDAQRGLPACASCHGVGGKGGAAACAECPVIGGQHRTYLRGQLIRWRMGERRNSTAQVMNGIAQRLSEDEIDALSDYLSRQ